MNHVPLITTVITTYKRPMLLKRAIDSVLNQTFKNLQVCVYDNASLDETSEIVLQYARIDPRVKYYCHPTNIGAARNVEFGVNSVNTPFFSILADDDFLFPDFYEIGIGVLGKNSNAGFFWGNSIAVDSKKLINDIAFRMPKEEKLYSPQDAINNFLLNKDFHLQQLTWSGVIFNTEISKNHNHLDLNIFKEYQIVSDVDYMLRMICTSYMFFSNTICAAFYTHDFSTSKNMSEEYFLSKAEVTFNNLQNEKIISLEVKNMILKLLNYNAAKRLIKNKNFKDACKKIEAISRIYDDPKTAKILKMFLFLRKFSILWHLLLISKKSFFTIRSKIVQFFFLLKKKKETTKNDLKKTEENLQVIMK